MKAENTRTVPGTGELLPGRVHPGSSQAYPGSTGAVAAMSERGVRGVASDSTADPHRVTFPTPTAGSSRRRTSGPRNRTRRGLLSGTARVGSVGQLDLFSRVLLDPPPQYAGGEPRGTLPPAPVVAPVPDPVVTAATTAVVEAPTQHAPASLRDGVFLLSVVALVALAWFGA